MFTTCKPVWEVWLVDSIGAKVMQRVTFIVTHWNLRLLLDFRWQKSFDSWGIRDRLYKMSHLSVHISHTSYFGSGNTNDILSLAEIQCNLSSWRNESLNASVKAGNGGNLLPKQRRFYDFPQKIIFSDEAHFYHTPRQQYLKCEKFMATLSAEMMIWLDTFYLWGAVKEKMLSWQSTNKELFED